jgi:ribosome-associated protein
VPINRKTSNSKSMGRKKAAVNPQVAGNSPGNGKAAQNELAQGNATKGNAITKGSAAKGNATTKSNGAKGSKRSAAKTNVAKASPSLKAVVIDALADMKALEVKVLDVRGLTDVADFMVIASGTSDRHVRSVAQRVVERTKEAGFRPHGVEGQQDSDWVLIDLSEMIVHVMLPRVREFYGLEKLWDITATKRAARA